MNFITISRKMGTNGTEIAKLVARELRYNYYGTEEIEKKAREMGFLDDIKKVDDKAPSKLERLFSYRPEILLDHLYIVIYELARFGNAVILGRGGNMLFNSLPYALHIRIIASREKRLNNLLERGYEREKAFLLMGKTDQERESFVKFAFKKDWENPDLYDMVFNMDKFSVNTAVDMILCAVRADEITGRSSGKAKALEMMEMAVKVRTALAEAGFPSGYISAFVDLPGKVRLTGVVQVPWEKTAAGKAAQEVEGVLTVENKIEVAGR